MFHSVTAVHMLARMWSQGGIDRLILSAFIGGKISFF